MMSRHAVTNPVAIPSPFEGSLSNARDTLMAQGGFATIPLPLTADEAKQLATLWVGRGGNWDYFGSPEKVLPHIEMIALEIGNPASVITALFAERVADIFQKTLNCFNTNAGWLCIRTFMPNKLGEPRWHTDGNFFSNPEQVGDKVQMKLAFCLQGRTTLFSMLSDADRAEFDSRERELSSTYYNSGKARGSDDQKNVDLCEARSNELQRQLNLIAVRGKVVAPVSGLEAGLFAVGESPNAALHSEPPFDVPRIFVSIVPGTISQIEELRKRWQGS